MQAIAAITAYAALQKKFSENAKGEFMRKNRMADKSAAQSTAPLKDLMNAPPITPEQYNAIQRAKVANRRRAEDAQMQHQQFQNKIKEVL